VVDQPELLDHVINLMRVSHLFTPQQSTNDIGPLAIVIFLPTRAEILKKLLGNEPLHSFFFWPTVDKA